MICVKCWLVGCGRCVLKEGTTKCPNGGGELVIVQQGPPKGTGMSSMNIQLAETVTKHINAEIVKMNYPESHKERRK